MIGNWTQNEKPTGASLQQDPERLKHGKIGPYSQTPTAD